MCSKRKQTGFTLIELLIVVAIIGILAAIAIPNFLEAQVRAKVASNKADMRTVVTALEMYRVDHNVTPAADYLNTINGGWHDWAYNNFIYIHFDPSLGWGDNGCFYLTTPVAYLSSIPIDPFVNVGNHFNSAYKEVGFWYTSLDGALKNQNSPLATRSYLEEHKLTLDGQKQTVSFMLTGPGPDGNFEYNGPGYEGVFALTMSGATADSFVNNGGSYSIITYDPTNGTISGGDIIRIQ